MSANPLVHVKIYQESRNKKAPKKKKTLQLSNFETPAS